MEIKPREAALFRLKLELEWGFLGHSLWPHWLWETWDLNPLGLDSKELTLNKMHLLHPCSGHPGHSGIALFLSIAVALFPEDLHLLTANPFPLSSLGAGHKLSACWVPGSMNNSV